MRTLRAGDQASARGYTLFELLIVLVIMSIGIGAAAQSLMQRTPGLQLRSGTANVAAVLREARSLAIRDNRESRVIIDVEARTLRIGSSSHERELKGELGLSLYTARAELESGDRGAIRFFPDGTSTGGRVSLFTEAQVNEVVVNWLTGNVEIHEDVR